MADILAELLNFLPKISTTFFKKFQKLAEFGQKTTFVEKTFLTFFWKISSRKTPESLSIVLLIPTKLWACAVFGTRIVTASYLAPPGHFWTLGPIFVES